MSQVQSNAPIFDSRESVIRGNESVVYRTKEYSLWKYVILAAVVYIALTKGLNLDLSNRQYISVLAVIVVTTYILDNYDPLSLYIIEPMVIVKGQQYVKIPNLNTAPDYNQNVPFKMHDKAMNYYYGYYPPNGTAPEGNDLQNFYQPLLMQKEAADLSDDHQTLNEVPTQDNTIVLSRPPCQGCNIRVP
jgi:hypothetical protein